MNMNNRNDITAIYETWDVNGERIQTVSTKRGLYACETINAVKFRKFGRASGGIAVFIRTDINFKVTRVEEKFLFGIFLKFESNCSQIQTDIICCFCYIPPQYSTRYRTK